MNGSGGPLVLVVDDEAGMRRLARTALELEGYQVVEAATLAQARSVTAEQVSAVVLDRHLPDGDGLDVVDELRRRWPDAAVVLHSAETVPGPFRSVAKGDVVTLVEILAPAGVAPPAGAPDVARARADEIVQAWVELCRWDPELPSDSRPPVAGSVVDAVAAALERPQPVGWGLDPALDAVAETYLLNHAAVDAAVAQLVCLREAFEREVVGALPVDERTEAVRRLTMIVERLMVHVVRSSLARRAEDVFVDATTGLGNRRAFEIDLRREVARAERLDRPLSVVRLVVDGLDLAAGGHDDLRVAAAVVGKELAYRVGERELALLLPDEVVANPGFLRARLGREAIQIVAAATATYPQDPLDELERLSEERLARP